MCNSIKFAAFVVSCLFFLGADNAATAPYTNDFEKAEVGKVPDDLLIAAGAFAVRKEGQNQFLELAGEPLESFGFLAGPEGATTAAARIRAASAGRRFPELGIGLGGPAGYKLWLMPAVKELQLIRGDDVVARIPYTWTSESWTVFRLQVRKIADGKWRLEGKAWQESQKEPADWMISFDDSAPPPAGRASMWGTPYSGKPIAFDDLVAQKEK
jgi:hypothetical protein